MDAEWRANEGLLNGLFSDRGFTSHKHLDDHKVIHMDGRLYDPLLGRFFSVDPIIQDLKNTQSQNAYTYVMNNPLSMIDPTGYQAKDIREPSSGSHVEPSPVAGSEKPVKQNDNGKKVIDANPVDKNKGPKVQVEQDSDSANELLSEAYSSSSGLKRKINSRITERVDDTKAYGITKRSEDKIDSAERALNKTVESLKKSQKNASAWSEQTGDIPASVIQDIVDNMTAAEGAAADLVAAIDEAVIVSGDGTPADAQSAERLKLEKIEQAQDAKAAEYHLEHFLRRDGYSEKEIEEIIIRTRPKKDPPPVDFRSGDYGCPPWSCGSGI